MTLSATERVIRQWFTLHTKIQPKNISLASIVISLYRVYQSSLDTPITDQIGEGAIKEVVLFLDWVLFKMTLTNFSHAQNPFNPEEEITF